MWKPQDPLQDLLAWVSVPPSYLALNKQSLNCFDLKIWLFLYLHTLLMYVEVHFFSRWYNCFDLNCFVLFVRFFFCLKKSFTFHLVIFDVTFLGHCHPSPKYGDAKRLYPSAGATCLPLIFKIWGKMFIRISWGRKHTEQKGYKMIGLSLKLSYPHLGVCIRCFHVTCVSELPKQGTEMQLLPKYSHPVLCEMLAGLSCCPIAATLSGQEWTGLV